MLCGCDQQAANRAMSPSCGDWPESCSDTGSKNTVTKNRSCSFYGNIIMQEFIFISLCYTICAREKTQICSSPFLLNSVVPLSRLCLWLVEVWLLWRWETKNMWSAVESDAVLVARK